MKKSLALTLVLIALVAGAAFADDLAVNNAAALGGSGTACGGSNCGLEVMHDNTSPAFVEDGSPSDETTYRFEFLYDPNGIGATATNSPAQGYRFTIFGAYGANPRPNLPGNLCPLNANIPVFPIRIFAIFGGPGQTVPGVRMTMMSNQCGVAGTPGIFWADGNARKLCGYVIAAATAGTNGESGLAVVGPGDTCPAYGDAAYGTAFTPNIELPVTFARLGVLANNPFNAGEDGSFYVDEFASFRTLSP